MRYLIVLSLLFTGHLVSATAGRADCAGGPVCSDVLVEMMHIDLGGLWIKTSGDERLLEGCVPLANEYLRFDAAQRNYEAIYSLLLSAHLQQLPLDIRMANGSDPCSVVWVKSDHRGWQGTDSLENQSSVSQD